MITGAIIFYQYVLLVFDFLHLLCRAVVLTLLAAWRTVSPQAPKSVAGELVLITGAGHGIGRELSLQFARLGAKVICLDIDETNNNKTVSDISVEGGAVWGYRCDVSKREEVQKVAAKDFLRSGHQRLVFLVNTLMRETKVWYRNKVKIKSEVGEVDILINNAGIMPSKPFLKHSPEEVHKIFDINVYSQFWTIQEWLPDFITRRSGHIVSVSSIAGLMATSNLVPYCASKYAVKGLMEGLTEELRYAGRHPNIRLTCIHPFVVDTGLAQKPRIRFPSLNPITSAEQCATRIIEGVRREEEVVCIPGKDFYVLKIANALPREVYKAFLDFMDTGMDEDDL